MRRAAKWGSHLIEKQGAFARRPWHPAWNLKLCSRGLPARGEGAELWPMTWAVLKKYIGKKIIQVSAPVACSLPSCCRGAKTCVPRGCWVQRFLQLLLNWQILKFDHLVRFCSTFSPRSENNAWAWTYMPMYLCLCSWPSLVRSGHKGYHVVNSGWINFSLFFLWYFPRWLLMYGLRFFLSSTEKCIFTIKQNWNTWSRHKLLEPNICKTGYIWVADIHFENNRQQYYDKKFLHSYWALLCPHGT